MRWAVYDLRLCPPSFDFIAFLVLAKYHGAEAILFIPGICERKLGQYTEAQQRERMKTILFPACDLYGMKWIYASPSEAMEADIAWPPFYRTGRWPNGYTMGWLKSIKKPEPFMPSQQALERARKALGDRTIVVHMRTMDYQYKRNSSPDWRRWARDRNAYVLSDDPISLDDRLGFMEAAKLNIGVSAGPMSLCHLSQRPYVVIKYAAGESSSDEAFFKAQGWKPGEQYPWANKQQLVVWNDSDSYEAIEAAYSKWLANNPKELACTTAPQ